MPRAGMTTLCTHTSTDGLKRAGPRRGWPEHSLGWPRWPRWLGLALRGAAGRCARARRAAYGPACGRPGITRRTGWLAGWLGAGPRPSAPLPAPPRRRSGSGLALAGAGAAAAQRHGSAASRSSAKQRAGPRRAAPSRADQSSGRESARSAQPWRSPRWEGSTRGASPRGRGLAAGRGPQTHGRAGRAGLRAPGPTGPPGPTAPRPAVPDQRDTRHKGQVAKRQAPSGQCHAGARGHASQRTAKLSTASQSRGRAGDTMHRAATRCAKPRQASRRPAAAAAAAATLNGGNRESGRGELDQARL